MKIDSTHSFPNGLLRHYWGENFLRLVIINYVSTHSILFTSYVQQV